MRLKLNKWVRNVVRLPYQGAVGEWYFVRKTYNIEINGVGEGRGD